MKEDCGNIPCDSINPRDELNLLKRQWQREALLEAADWFEKAEYDSIGTGNWRCVRMENTLVGKHLRRMAKELE